MSKKVQQKARASRDAARVREVHTRARAKRNAKTGKDDTARLHDHSADLHAAAARRAGSVLERDQRIEGDQLDE